MLVLPSAKKSCQCDDLSSRDGKPDVAYAAAQREAAALHHDSTLSSSGLALVTFGPCADHRFCKVGFGQIAETGGRDDAPVP